MKVFDVAGKDSIQSAEDADLYKAFAYLSFKSAEMKLEQEALMKQQLKT